ncbi:MAG: hemerythrin family protein [Campylobacterales bacterium]|nr:hemerythrin family protein [Campylobacterales bacterium]
MPTSGDKVLWSQAYEIGIEEVDNQHQGLVEIINKANHLLIGEYTSKELEDVITDLIDYTLEHFGMEEGLMHTHHFDSTKPQDYEKHIQEHREFSTKVEQIRDDLAHGKITQREEIINYLCDWLIRHTNRTDRVLGKFLEKAGA